MAEGFAYPTSNILCRYYVHGACRLGDNCRFSHNRENAMSTVCKYYVLGCCSYGDKCRYDHVKPKSSPTGKAVYTTSREPLKTPVVTTTNDDTSTMVSLKEMLRGGPNKKKSPVIQKSPDEWVKASEFIPGQPYYCSSIPNSYADAAHTGVETVQSDETGTKALSHNELLCPYSANKECPYGENCEYIHGDICELCGLAVLKPGDDNQQGEHRKECLAQHEKDMEVSFAIARSKDKQCSICMDVVYEKEPATERRFGIMSDCVHCFCLACIRKWRSSKQFDNKTIRSCPECRIQSDFVTPSKYWVDTKEEKIKLIQGYKTALSEKKCKYFDEGRGECPFNDKCFYLHAYPDGRKASPKPRKRRCRQNADGHLDLMDNIFLWDFLQEREDRLQRMLLLELLEDDLTDLIFNLGMSSPEISDDSDDEFDLAMAMF